VFEAIQLMAEKNIGSLLVIKDNNWRHYHRTRLHPQSRAQGRASKDTRVNEILSGDVVAFHPIRAWSTVCA